MSPDLRVFVFGSVFYALSAAVGAKAAQPDAARLFVDFALSEAGQKIIASLMACPSRLKWPINLTMSSTISALGKICTATTNIFVRSLARPNPKRGPTYEIKTDSMAQ